MKKSIIILLLAFVCSSVAMSQENFIPLNKTFSLKTDQLLNISEDNFHTSVKPLNARWVNEIIETEESDTTRKWLYRKLKQDHLIHIKQKDFDLTIDPLFDFNYGVDRADTTARARDTRFITNTRAALVTGKIGESITFSSSFYENQTYFRGYINDYVLSKRPLDSYNRLSGIVPGQGRVKPFKEEGFDYAMASSNVTFTPNAKLSFSLGNGKHFIGEGYRSLFLSDNAFNYPYFSGTVNLGAIQYTTIYSVLQNYYRMPGFATADALFQRKKASFSFLSWNVNKKIQLGFFEGIIWKSLDTSLVSKFNYNYLNPVMFTRTLQYSLSNEINAMVGISAKVKAFKGGVFYGQFMLDELKHHDKLGYQIGLKVHNAFKVKNLYLQGEYNSVSAFSYAHRDSSQSYSNLLEPLAHPMGANFNEFVGIINYEIKSIRLGVKYVHANSIQDTTGTNSGNNIFTSESDGRPESGISTATNYLDVNLSYLLNPKTDMRITLGLSNRLYSNEIVTDKSNFIYLAFRTSLRNIYYDF